MKMPIQDLIVRPFHLWAERWFLLAAGDFAAGDYNAMTVSWGSLGTMWGRPFVQIVVRPTRHTFGFLERHDTFTLSAFDERYRDALNLLGSRSGREGDKIAAAGLTPAASAHVAAPSFAEADLVLECRKIYWQDFEPRRFLDPSIARLYEAQDYHRAWFGEILAVFAAPGSASEGGPGRS